MIGTTRALDGLHLVTLAPNLPGPLAAARLRDMGMRVTKVESPAGDPFETYCAQWYRELHEGMEVVTLDLKSAQGRERFGAVLGTADLLLTSTRPATLGRLGLGWDTLHAAHPRLCQVAIIGEAPPRDGAPGHDLTYQSVAGLVRPPQMPMTLVADLGGALEAIIAALALLARRDRHGEAGCTLVALADAAHYFAQPSRWGLTGAPDRMLGGGYALYDLYETAEGWIAVAGLEGHFRDTLLAQFPGDGSERARLTAGFRTRRADEWHAWAESVDLPIVAVRRT